MKALIIYDDLTGATRTTAAWKRAAWRANVSADWDIKPWQKTRPRPRTKRYPLTFEAYERASFTN
jgi:hypothetical protein